MPEETDNKMFEQINKADYHWLLTKWRLEPAGSLWFIGEVGQAFCKAMGRERSKLSYQEQVDVSKSISKDSGYVSNLSGYDQHIL